MTRPKSIDPSVHGWGYKYVFVRFIEIYADISRHSRSKTIQTGAGIQKAPQHPINKSKLI